jgi:hypothetical protein
LTGKERVRYWDYTLDIRFKEDVLNQYVNYIRLSKITTKVSTKDGFYEDYYFDEENANNKRNDKIYFNETEMEGYKLIAEVIEYVGGLENYYEINIKNKKDSIGESQYGLY